MLIYVLINSVTGKRYVGQTIQKMGQRWSQHKRDAGKVDDYLHNAMHSYGIDAFFYDIYWKGECTADELDAMEKQAILDLKTHRSASGYNIDWGGQGGRTRDEETKAKISKAMKGRVFSATTIERMKVANRNAVTPEKRANLKASRNKRPPPSEETKAKIGAAHKGMKRSEETKRRISAGNRGRTVSAEARRNISKANKARGPVSELTRQRLREAQRVRREREALAK